MVRATTTLSMEKTTVSKITVTVNKGAVSFSFETDKEGSNIEGMLSTIEKIISARRNLIDKFGRGDKTPTEPRRPLYAPTVRLSDLNIPSDIRQRFVDNVKRLSNWDITLFLLNHAQEGLTNKQLRSLSEQFGKPVSYSWFDTEFHRRRSEGLVVSRPSAMSKERLYFATELGKKQFEKRTSQLVAENLTQDASRQIERSGKSLLHERILELSSEGYFKDPKSANEIRAELRNRGYAYTFSSLGMGLLALTRKKALRRILERKGEKTLYLYTTL